MADTINLCAQVPRELYDKVRTEKDELGLSLSTYVAQILKEHFEGGIPTISVLPDSSISARIYALLNVVKGQAELEMLALNAKESFDRNQSFYRERLNTEQMPVIRRLLEQDSSYLDRIQALMASSREFYLIIRLRDKEEPDVLSYLSRIEQSINDNGFAARQAGEQELKRMLGLYFEQNVTTEHFEDSDGDRWMIVGE